MKTGGMPVLALVLLFTSCLVQANVSEEIFVDNEDDAQNEYLEVKENSITNTLSRIKRGFFDFFNTNEDKALDAGQNDDEESTTEDDLDSNGYPSGTLPDVGEDAKEKTIRVIFVVMEPYQPEYTNRDSEELRNLSKSLSDAIDLLFKQLPGEQRTSLVGIESIASDEFSCKVTLDIATTGYYNLNVIAQTLRDHIKAKNHLGKIQVRDTDFNAFTLYADTDFTKKIETHGDEDGEEAPVETPTTTTTTSTTTPAPECENPIPCQFSDTAYYCPSRRCDKVMDCPYGDDEDDCPKSETTTAEVPADCSDDEMRCDDTRCVQLTKRCDGVSDCYDGKDEAGCNTPEECGADDFRCTSNNKCIEKHRRCDRVVDCPYKEDETDCECIPGEEFKCISDGFCIESRKQCDGTTHCEDGSDEQNCEPCPDDSFQCFDGNCAQHCNGVVECASGEDEQDCAEECHHHCDGRCLEDDLICNQVDDCSDGSDELNCDHCDGPEDFRCDNGKCINRALRCNTLADCTDGSDEYNCDVNLPAPKCYENQFQCRDEDCIDKQFVCDGNPDCNDNSDEEDCPCSADSFKCTSGQCIPTQNVCDGILNCDDGSDEVSCATKAPYSPNYPIFARTTTYRPIYTTTAVPYRPYYPPSTDARVALKLRTEPKAQSVRTVASGGDVVFQCRDEGPVRARVVWVREDGSPIKSDSVTRKGRLEMYKVSRYDAGVYICQTPDYLGADGSQARVTLTVEPPTVTQAPSQFIACQPHEATCGNGQCIPKSSVCDRKYDCSDHTDEDECSHNGFCEPNQFKCTNRKCVSKAWVCDSDDDCGDGSDERDCGTPAPGDYCSPAEFSCNSRNQCIPKSFYCDGINHCIDGSDEVGCITTYIKKPPSPQNQRLNIGDTLYLKCEAVGVPTPLISWRLNWGHVPDKCRSTSVDGVGSLVCPNMQPEDSGAYSCEAINIKGTNFAVPDAIVFVNRTAAVCPPGYFNSEARSESECIRCFCFGESTQCKSADLYTFNMATPLGEGGTRLVGVKTNYDGSIEINQAPINNLYYYEPQYNGAVVTKLETYAPRNSHAYISLPESYNGNQLTSYGGSIGYKIQPHSVRTIYENNVPDIIINGKYAKLVHFDRHPEAREIRVETRLLPSDWKKIGPKGVQPATREDIMMALDNIESILLRSDLNGAGVNISDFTMQSADRINVGLGAASFVEECQCPPGYEGLSCQKCSSGYTRESSGPWLGNCIKEEASCQPGTYGDPYSNLGCQPCPCPLTNRENQFAETCSIGPDGRVRCDCMPGYEGPNCGRCAQGYVGNPWSPGDSCRPDTRSSCNPVGTSWQRGKDQCECKKNVRGQFCDECEDGHYYLSPDFSHGCARCFCMGVSQECTSSNLRRKTTSVIFNNPQAVEDVKVYSSTPTTSPVETSIRPQLYRGELTLSNFDRSGNTVYYWGLSKSFAGNMVTSYGGFLRYTLRHLPASRGLAASNNAPDIQLISDNHTTFYYYGNFAPPSDGFINGSVQLLEKGWQTLGGKEVLQEKLLVALADVKTILIKATYTSNTQMSTLLTASIDTAENNGDGPQALHVEQCRCPPEYVGTSCESCAPGFTRISSGLYLQNCEPCQCNGHSEMCHPKTRVCFNCADNTAGDSCEYCKPGYEKDNYGQCVPTSPDAPCSCDERGIAQPCDSGECVCKQNVVGRNCDQCRPGSFGLASENVDGCISCYCSGVTNNCHEGNQYSRMPIPAPILGETYGGYTLMNINADSVINNNFLPSANESELSYVFDYPPDEDLYWSLPGLPGNRVLSYGGYLSLTQKFDTGGYDDMATPGNDIVLVGEDISLYWTNPNPLQDGQSLAYRVPLRQDNWYILNSNIPATRQDFMSVLSNLKRILVRATPTKENLQSTSIADVAMDSATDSFAGPAASGVEVCMCPEGYAGTSCESCSPGFYRNRNKCEKCSCNNHDCQLGPYGVVCNCRPPYTGPDCSSVAGEASTNYTTRPPPPQSTVMVRITSPVITIKEVGTSVNFTCQAQSRLTQGPLNIRWIKKDGYLPQGRTYTDQQSGLLLIREVQVSDSGRYICQASDGVSTEEASATLQVGGNSNMAPTVRVSPVNREYYEGDRIELYCEATGLPVPKLTWIRGDNKPLPFSSESVYPYLIIASASVEDSGEYKCIARNAAGTTDRSSTIVVRPRQTWPPAEKLSVSPSSATVAEGQNIKVICTASSAIPPGSIGWSRKDGSDLLANARSSNGVLYIDLAQLENGGVYVCQTSAPGVTPVPVLISVEPVGTPPPSDNPSVTLVQDRYTVPTGENTIIECTPHGYPLPVIRWKKYQEEFGPGASQRENSLIISNAQESDRGIYVCEGYLDDALVTNTYVSIEIERRERPTVQILPQGEQFVPLGGEFEFRCQILGGYPEPTVTWDRTDGRPLAKHAQIQPHHVLRFEKVEVNDEGEYSCTARNVAGSETASAVLKVRATPEIIISNNDVTVANGDPVRVECRAAGYPEPMVSISKDNMEIVSPNAGIAVLNINSAVDTDSGDYTCTATSAAGTTQDRFVVYVDSRSDGGYGLYDPGGSGESPDFNEINNIRVIVAIDGQDANLYCNDETNEFAIEWTKQGSPLPYNARQYDNVLKFVPASKDDAGYYICTLIDKITGEDRGTFYTQLKVLRPPRITVSPQSQAVNPGESPRVQCIVDGDEIWEVTWTPVSPDKPYSSRMEVRDSTLIFHEIEVEDAGRYQCFARNPVANASGVAEVFVNEALSRPPKESHDNEQYAHSGAGVHLSCNVTQPNLRISWTKNRRPLPRSVVLKKDGSLFIGRAQKSDSGRYECIIEDSYGRQAKNYINLHIEGNTVGPVSLVSIDQPNREFSAGENVRVLCRALSRDVSVTWEKLNTRLFVKTTTYGDGAIMLIDGVQETDAGVYRCKGQDRYGRTSFEDFNLAVSPAQNQISYPLDNDKDHVYTAQLRQDAYLPCTHDLGDSATVTWIKEYVPLPSYVQIHNPELHLRNVTEADAGAYVCQVSNDKAVVEARAILRVTGVVPSFKGVSWLSLPNLKDVHTQFDLEITFKPTDKNGLILYNSQNQGRAGDYIALQLVDGVLNFVMDSGTGPIVVMDNEEVSLNNWHTVRLNWFISKVTMEVDRRGPFVQEWSKESSVMELYQPLYIGGVPDPDQLPETLAGASGFLGCVSVLKIGEKEVNIMLNRISDYEVDECPCEDDICLNNGICQGASNERGYECLCARGYAGKDCSRTGEACVPGICGPGKCTDTADGYRCTCPVKFSGKRCEVQKAIEYPAFTGNSFLAINMPKHRIFTMSMKVKAASLPIPDGIIMYCAESPNGQSGFTSLAVKDGHLDFRYDLGEGSGPVVLTSTRPLQDNEWTEINLSRIGDTVSLVVNKDDVVTGKTSSTRKILVFNTPLFVGGYDDSITLNQNTGVQGGFSGCIKDVVVLRHPTDIVNSFIKSENIHDCSEFRDRGDIPDIELRENVCDKCRNGGSCRSVDSLSCSCPSGYSGKYCEVYSGYSEQRDPCKLSPCRNGGTCKQDYSSRMNYTCDCPLGFAGAICQMRLDLFESVGFNGNGYLELPGQFLRYGNLDREPALIALAVSTTSDGVLLYQRELNARIGSGDFILLRIENGRVVMDWDLGGGVSSISVDDKIVADGSRHRIIAKLLSDRTVYLSVDDYVKTAASEGFSNVMNADSNIYIGGIPEPYNVERYPGLSGCFEQIELMDLSRGLKLGRVAVAARNAKRCRD